MTRAAFKGSETKASTTPANAAPNIGIETPEYRTEFLPILAQSLAGFEMTLIGRI